MKKEVQYMRTESDKVDPIRFRKSTILIEGLEEFLWCVRKTVKSEC
jgi:hypothetical protein